MRSLAQPVEELKLFTRGGEALLLFGQPFFPDALLRCQAASLSSGKVMKLGNQGKFRCRDGRRIGHAAAFFQYRILERFPLRANLIESGVHLLEARFFDFELLLLPAPRGLKREL
ncbi:MAG: hypothetical protein ACRD4P_00615 [Bryobacteraceae bacterium]